MNALPRLPAAPSGTWLVGSLPLLASILFAALQPQIDLDVGLSFAVLGLMLSMQLVASVRGRSNTAADASVLVFGLLFLLMAPVVQISVLGFNLVNTTHGVPGLIVETNLACSLFIGAYLLARMTVARSPVALPVVAGALPARNSLFALFCLTGLCVFITLVSIPFAGATAADGSITPVLLAFRKFLFFVPTAMFLITLAEYKGSGTQRNFAHVLLLVVLFLCIVATQNPGTEKRNALGPVYLSVLFLMFRPWLQRKGVQVFWLVLVLLVLFPLSSLFTHVQLKYLSEDDFKLTVLSDHFLSTHYDAWANVYTSIEMVGRNGLSAGKQLLGALLFYVPSSWWPGKPLATGIEIGNFLENYYTMWFTNLSAPLMAEGFLDFGYIGVAGYGALLALAVGRIERWASPGRAAVLQAVAIYLGFFLVFLLRGSMMIAFAYGSGALTAFAFSWLMLGLFNLATPARRLVLPALPGATS